MNKNKIINENKKGILALKEEIFAMKNIKLPKNARLFRIVAINGTMRSMYVLRHYETNVLTVEYLQNGSIQLNILIDKNEISQTTKRAIDTVAEFFGLENVIDNITYTNKNKYTQEFRDMGDYRFDYARRYTEADWKEIAEQVLNFVVSSIEG